jgi:quercetin dioxygenase-like cupin family protein
MEAVTMSHRDVTVTKRRCLTRALWTLSLILLPATATARSDTPGKHLGSEFKLATPTPITELTAHPEKYFNQQVRIEGVIASACTNEGCFLEVVPEGGGEGIVVNFPELTQLFPTQCAGAHAIVEGLFYQKVYPAARLLHWQGHSFHAGQPMPDFALIRRIAATAAFVTDERTVPPAPGEIVRAQTDRLDLARVEFEAEGFGAGRKWLQPGDSTESHSTGNNREIVICMEGQLTVLKPGASPVVLLPGEMTYLAPQTRHGLKNLSGRPAAYVFVFSRKLEPEKPHEH